MGPTFVSKLTRSSGREFAAPFLGPIEKGKLKPPRIESKRSLLHIVSFESNFDKAVALTVQFLAKRVPPFHRWQASEHSDSRNKLGAELPASLLINSTN